MNGQTVGRIITESGRRFVVEQRTAWATHGRRSRARLYEITDHGRVNIESLDSSLQDTSKAVESAVEKVPFHLGNDDAIDEVMED